MEARYRTEPPEMTGLRYRREKSIDCKAKVQYSTGNRRDKRFSLVVSTAALTLVAGSGVHHGLVDLPLGTGLVTRLGLERGKKS